MEGSDELFTVFSAEIESSDGDPTIAVPEREISIGDLAVGETYRVAVLGGPAIATGDGDEIVTDREQSRDGASPPVEDGETLDVEIEDVGDQGDGIARIGPGYIVFVPDTEIGDRVTIEITQARENFAFAEVVEHEPVTG